MATLELMLKRMRGLIRRRASSVTVADLPAPVVPSNSTGVCACTASMALLKLAMVPAVSTSGREVGMYCSASTTASGE
jgi:hypothetical protein